MKKFYEMVSKNQDLLTELRGKSQEAIVALAKEYGITLTEDDFPQMVNVEKQAISDDELENVAGGKCGHPIDEYCPDCGKHFTNSYRFSEHGRKKHGWMISNS